MVLTEKQLREVAKELNVVMGLKPQLSEVLDTDTLVEKLQKIIELGLIEPTDVFTPETDDVMKYLETIEPGTTPEVTERKPKPDLPTIHKQIEKSMKLKELQNVIWANIEFKSLRDNLEDWQNTEVLRDRMYEILTELKMNTPKEEPTEVIEGTIPVKETKERKKKTTKPVEEAKEVIQPKESLKYDLLINPLFESACPPLTEAEYKGLEELILKDGRILHPILIWDNTIIDGHNRYKIAKDNELPYIVEEMKFNSEDDALAWIKENAVSQRNLPPYVKYEMIKDLQVILGNIGQAKRSHKLDDISESVLAEAVKDGERFNARKELAEKAGLSESQIQKARVVDKLADEKTKEDLRKGKTTIGAVHSELSKAKVLTDEEKVKVAIKMLEKWVKKYNELLPVYAETITDIAIQIKEETTNK